jgi:membrane protease YdiL (CAAX protease family)
MSDLPQTGEPVDPSGHPLTGAVIAPGWALAYVVGLLLLNLGLQAASRSSVVLGPLIETARTLAPAGAAHTLAVATLTALIAIGSYALMLVPAIALAVTARRKGVSLATAVGLRRFKIGRTLKLALVLVVGAFAMTAVYAVIAGAMGVAIQGNAADLAAGFKTGPGEIVIAFVLVGIVAPFVEELTFRGIVFPSLKASWGTMPALLVSGAAFGIVHLQPTITVPLALIGMALAVVFLRTRSLWTAIIAHCAYNTVSLALAFLFIR